MAFFWDHEEIGSRSREGAGSPFFEETLKRICNCLKMDEEDYFRLKGNSLFVSIDMAQGFNPNYAAKYEVNHSSFLGKGITIKYNADQKYASSASSAAPVITACRQLSLPYQSHVGRSDIPSGSTVGPIVAASTGIKTVDIGCPQLAMHAAREVMACSDHLDMCQILTHLLEEK
jgi:aspartyl aminopeptidase